MPESEWTLDALKAYMDQRFDDHHERLSEFKTEYTTHHDDLVRQVTEVRNAVAESGGGQISTQRALTYTIAAVTALAAVGGMIAYIVVGHP